MQELVRMDCKEVDQKKYREFLSNVRNCIQDSTISAGLALSKELNKMYWGLGQIIVEQQQREGWGSGILEKLAADLRTEYPDMRGLSRTNFFRMRAFYLAYSEFYDEQNPYELAVFSIPWGHNIVLLEQVKTAQKRIWYAQNALECGWSRNALKDWIKSKLFERDGKAITNFKARLPSPHSEMAQDALKDPYDFNFFDLQQGYLEKDIEKNLLENIRTFLVALGKGFAFLGNQYHIEVAGKDYFIDMLFYHVKLHCYVVVEIKRSSFTPRDAGQLNFYLSAVDNKIKASIDNPTIGILLCEDKNGLEVEYALQDLNKPIGVASYNTKLTNELPEMLQENLPTCEEIGEKLDNKINHK